MKFKNIHYYSFFLFLTFSLLGCSSESGPVTLPVPFSGGLTSETNVVISDGAPLETSSNTALKLQTPGGNSSTIVWENFDSRTGCSRGKTTFFLDTMTAPILTPLSNGNRRQYSLSACFELDPGTEVCSSNLQCFEFPSDLPPLPFTASEIAPEDPDAEAVPRKALCSGNIDSGSGNFTLGALIDARFVLGMVELSNGDLQFVTQEKSSIFIQGVSASTASDQCENDVLYTMVPQGYLRPIPNQVLGQPLVDEGSLFLPGIALPAGTIRISESPDGPPVIITNESFDGFIDFKLCISTSCLLVQNTHVVETFIPELSEITADAVRKDFSVGIDPAALNDFLDGAIASYTLAGGGVGEHDPIDCDKQTGMFKQLCNDFGPLRLDYRCDTFINPERAFSLNFPYNFTLGGTMILSRQN